MPNPVGVTYRFENKVQSYAAALQLMEVEPVDIKPGSDNGFGDSYRIALITTLLNTNS